MLDPLRLLDLEFSDLLIDVHLFLVQGALVLHSLVEEHAEAVSFMDAVDHHGQKSHLLVVADLLDEVVRLDATELPLDNSNFLVEGTENVRVLVAGIHQNQSYDLGPKLLFINDELIDGGQDLILFLTR